MSGVVERARSDLEAGRPWMARDRLVGALSGRQDDELIDLLAEVYLAMNDLPAAGALWAATGRDDDRTRGAVAAWAARHPNDASRWTSIPRVVREGRRSPTTDELRTRVGTARAGRRMRPLPDLAEPTWTDRLAPVGCAAVALVLVALLGIGLWTVAHWLLA